MSGSIPGLHLLDARGTSSPVLPTGNVSRRPGRQTVPGGGLLPRKGMERSQVEGASHTRDATAPGGTFPSRGEGPRQVLRLECAAPVSLCLDSQLHVHGHLQWDMLSWDTDPGSALIALRREKEPQVEVPFQPPCGSRGLDGFPTCPSPHPTLNAHLAEPAVWSALKGLLDPPSFFYQLFDLRGWSPGGAWQPPEFSTLRGRPKTNKSMNRSRISFMASCDVRCPQIPESLLCRHRKGCDSRRTSVPGPRKDVGPLSGFRTGKAMSSGDKTGGTFEGALGV
nr:uncharacterized protein LOC132597229 [Globicephala melas]